MLSYISQLPSGTVFMYKNIIQAICIRHTNGLPLMLQNHSFKSNSIYEVISANSRGTNIYRKK